MKEKILKHSNLIACFMLVLMFCLGLFSMLGDSGTTDEVAHIPSGYTYLKYHDYRLNPEHPPLIKMLAALPLQFLDVTFPTEELAWQEGNQWESGWKFIYHPDNNADQIFFWARLPILLLSILLGIYIYRWTKEVFNKKVALIALFLFTLSPNIIAHSRLVTTDLGVTATFFIAMYYFYKFIKKPSWKYIIISGITLGIAQLVKFSNILLLAYLIILIIVLVLFYNKKIEFNFLGALKIKREWLKRLYVFFGSFIIMCLICFILVEIVYALVIFNTPQDLLHTIINGSITNVELNPAKDILHTMIDNPVLKPIGYYLLGLMMVFVRVGGGNTTYFLGETTNQSFWYFYPISFLIKTPITTLILFILSIIGAFKFAVAKAINHDNVSFLRKFWRTIKNYINDNLLEFIAISVIAMFFFVGIKGNLNIGMRHILPLYPFLFILCAKYFAKLFGKTNIALKVFGVLLLVWYAFSNFITYPSYLAYFNEFAGGVKNGYRYTTDSNVDWGQDLKRLAKFVDKNNIDHITIDYFGGSVPKYYIDESKITLWHSSLGKPHGWFAVSATYYQNSQWYAKTEGQLDYTWLNDIKPVEIIGGSILVYNLK